MNSALQKLPTKNKRIIIGVIVMVLIIGSAFFLEKKFHRKFNPPRGKTQQMTAFIKEKQLAPCVTGDDECLAKNEKITADQLKGSSAEYSRHQCDGPRICPTPLPEGAAKAITAIRLFAHDPKLEIVRMTGITPAGILYYCASDTRCWIYNTEDKRVTKL
jgi:hypothetical protein